ncbi:hypothetical protein M422DRAFT_240799 [Sphaerobolus stellatus SS14]|nr:hypothetical protein M422DRAFT_240799 [Sphaerobolus stellatus SS14]
MNDFMPRSSSPVQQHPIPPTLPQHDVHSTRSERIFIGPMPLQAAERNASIGEPNEHKRHWWLGKRRDTIDDNDIPEEDAFRYYLHQGGLAEEWQSQESLKRSVKRDMLRQWRQSGWAALGLKKSEKVSSKWIGNSFKIGEDFLGVPVHLDETSIRTSVRTSIQSRERSDGISRDLEPQARSSSAMASTFPSGATSGISYHTARGDIPTAPSFVSSSSSIHNADPRLSASIASNAPLISASEQTQPISTIMATYSSPSKPIINEQLLHVREPGRSVTGTRTEPAPVVTPITPVLPATPLRSALQRTPNEGPVRTVQFFGVPDSQVKPAPPDEVLARSEQGAPDTSAGAAASQLEERSHGVKWGDVVRKERMLVRRSNTKTGTVGMHFSAKDAMKLRDLRCHEWNEFIVVWRKDQIELYEDYTLPGKERLLGHKHLACVIPLARSDTHISVYSFVDMTFCLTCTTLHVPTETSRTVSSLTARIHFSRTRGTDIFVFKTKTRSSGVDWYWELWRHLGNGLPETFEVHCPTIDTRIKLRIPEYDENGGEAYKVFTKEKVLEICRSSLQKLPTWMFLVEPALKKGLTPELCWRKDAMLDWIFWDRDINDVDRPWAVVYGLALTKPKEIIHLELRLVEHRPRSVPVADGPSLFEPPSIEGYVYRIKPNMQIRAQVYLTTHGGCLFSVRPSRAHPPRPPLPPVEEGSILEDIQSTKTSFEQQELERAEDQILLADTFLDFRNIAAVRRAFQLRPLQDSPDDGADDNPQTAQEDEEDDGGDETLAKHPNKSRLRVRRSFELQLTSGSVIRYETYSCKVAQEWVERLRALVEYWKQRHRADAADEMKILAASKHGSGPVTRRPAPDPLRPPRVMGDDESAENLPAFWNWCVLEGCLAMVRSGRLFTKRKLRGQYRLMQLVLVSGHLVQFHITPQSSQNFRALTISLLDAYVCSGHYATQSLPLGEFSTSQPPLPRRFQDGLENEDHEWDTVFLIWYRPHAMGKTMNDPTNASIPSLKSKHKVLLAKARSKLERDSWCWALNAEIERLSRMTKERELRSLEGGLTKV